MTLKNPFKAMPVEMDDQFRARRENGFDQSDRVGRKAILRLAAMGLLGGIALGGTALLVRDQDFSWLIDKPLTQSVAETPDRKP